MKWNEIKEAVKTLARSQGMYGRLYQALTELEQGDHEDFERVKNDLEGQNFKDIVDMILFFES